MSTRTESKAPASEPPVIVPSTTTLQLPASLPSFKKVNIESPQSVYYSASNGSSAHTTFYTGRTSIQTGSASRIVETGTSKEQTDHDEHLPPPLSLRTPLDIIEGSSSDQELTLTFQNSTFLETVNEKIDPTSGKKDEDESSVDPEELDTNVFDELVHRPPFLPSVPVYSGFGRPTLRQSVISRQSTRIYPSSDLLREHMEEQLIRWGVPHSTFKADDILNGKHAFQSSDMPVLEANPPVGDVQTDQTTSIDKCTTNSTVDSIAKSPYVNATVPEAPTKTLSAFKEITPNPNSESLPSAPLSPERNDSDSIQDSAFFNAREFQDNQLCSASIKSAYMKRVVGEAGDTSDQVVDTNNNVTYEAATPNAYPLTEQDLPKLVRCPANSMSILPAAQTTQLEPSFDFNQNNNRPGHILQDDGDDDEEGCWNNTTGACTDIWTDMYQVITCSGWPIDSYDEYNI